MGQAYSYKDTSTPAPLEILSDPREASRFVCRRNAPSSKNYNVYKDSLDGPLWLFVRKKGQTLRRRDPTILVLENFHKDILCVARLDQKNDDYFSPTYSLKNFVKRMVNDQVEVGKTKHETIDTVACNSLEWKCQTKAAVLRSHSMTESLADVYVEGVGLVTRETQKIKERDSENFPSIKTTFKETKQEVKPELHVVVGCQIDRLQYMVHLAGGTELLFSVKEPNSPAPKWISPMFNAEVLQSTSGHQVWNIETKQGYDPTVALLVALVCSAVLCPEKIMRHIPVRWS